MMIFEKLILEGDTTDAINDSVGEFCLDNRTEKTRMFAHGIRAR